MGRYGIIVGLVMAMGLWGSTAHAISLKKLTVKKVTTTVSTPSITSDLRSPGRIVSTAKALKNAHESFSFTDQKELAIGRQMHPVFVARNGGEYTNRRLQSYLDRVGQKIAQQSSRPNIPYTFTILNTHHFNAFGAPGGYVYITRGLLTSLRDEAELASVLGHEVAHVAHKHGLKKYKTGMFARAGMGIVAGVAGAELGRAVGRNVGHNVAGLTANILTDAAVNSLGGVMATMFTQGYGRKNEIAADRHGIQYANAAGYDPDGAVRLLTKMQHLEGTSRPAGFDTLLSSHPNTKKRIKLAKKEVKNLDGPLGQMVNKVGFMKAIRGL
jgi:beta-barrel assembly-enhancing protease